MIILYRSFNCIDRGTEKGKLRAGQASKNKVNETHGILVYGAQGSSQFHVPYFCKVISFFLRQPAAGQKTASTAFG